MSLPRFSPISEAEHGASAERTHGSRIRDSWNHSPDSVWVAKMPEKTRTEKKPQTANQSRELYFSIHGSLSIRLSTIHAAARMRRREPGLDVIRRLSCRLFSAFSGADCRRPCGLCAA